MFRHLSLPEGGRFLLICAMMSILLTLAGMTLQVMSPHARQVRLYNTGVAMLRLGSDDNAHFAFSRSLDARARAKSAPFWFASPQEPLLKAEMLAHFHQGARLVRSGDSLLAGYEFTQVVKLAPANAQSLPESLRRITLQAIYNIELLLRNGTAVSPDPPDEVPEGSGSNPLPQPGTPGNSTPGL